MKSKLLFLLLTMFAFILPQGMSAQTTDSQPSLLIPGTQATITPDGVRQLGQNAANNAFPENSQTIVLDFEGIGDIDAILDFYNGGTSAGGFSGTDFGISFNSEALALIDADEGGNGNFANEPSPSTVMFFQFGTPILNLPVGFDTGFSLFQTNIGTAGNAVIEVYEDLDATGTLLGSFNLSSLASAGTGDPTGDFDTWEEVSIAFDGVAKSIKFIGAAGFIAFDDITFGNVVAGCDAFAGSILFDNQTDVYNGCIGSGDLAAINVVEDGQPVGENTGWIITDAADGTILGLPTAPPFDLSAAPAGTCNIYKIAYDEGLIGLMMQGNIANLEGCFDLSAPIAVNRFESPVVAFTALDDLAEDAGVQSGLGGGTPTGGVYSGPGVTDDGNGETYSFDPAAAGVDVHTITYTYTNANNCTDSASDDVEVTAAEPTGPANDLLENAIPVACGDSVLGTTIDATLDEADAPSVATVETDTGADVDSPWVWYSFTGTVPGERVTLSTCGTDNTDYDTELFVYTGSSGALTLIDDGFDECGGFSENFAAETSFDSDGSTTYFIAVGGWNTGDVGNFQLTVSCEAPPTCTPVVVEDAFVTETCNQDGTGTFTVTIDFDITTTSEFLNVALDIDNTTGAPLLDSQADGVFVYGPFDAGTPVDLYVINFDPTCSYFLDTFNFDCPQPGPANDLLENAIPVACGDSVLGTTIDATLDEADAPEVATIEPDTPADVDSPWVWYSFTGTVPGERVTLSTCGTDNTDFDTEIFVFTGTSGNLTLIDDGYDECGGSSENFAAETSFDSDGSTTYLIAIGGWNATTVGNFQLAVSCETPQPAPDNDLCDNATMIECGDTVSGTTDNATFDEAPFCGTSNTAPGVWYKFTGVEGNATLSTCNTASFDTKISVFTDGCGDLVCVDGNDDGDGCEGFTSELTIPTTAGTEYYVLVHGFGSNTGDFDLSLTCESTDPCPNNTTYEWTGTADTNWENASNWLDGNAPGLSIINGDVIIPFIGPETYYHPVLTVGQDLYIDECSSVTVEADASLIVNPNVVVSNDGTMANDGHVTFQSDHSGTAYVGPGMGMFIGEYTVERFIPAKRAYRQMSPAVTTSTPISENWQQDTHITGPAGNTDGFDVTETGNPSAYIFDNVLYEYVELENTNATNLFPGTMYHVLVRGDRNTDLTNNNATPSDTTLKATGELTADNNGTQTIEVNVPEQRFIAVGNPYQAQVDMNEILTTDATNINPNFYWIWDPTLGERGAYTAIDAATGSASAGDSDANQYLQSGQAGWVYTAGAGVSSVTFTQSSKFTGTETDVFRTANSTSVGQLRLSLYESNAFANNQTAADAVWILFDTNGNNDVDANDALNITNLDENMATNNNGVLLSIENRAAPQNEEEIQLEINTYRNTNYTIMAEGIAIQDATPFLLDQYTGSLTEIPQAGSVSYSYNVDPSITASISGDRFKIVFEANALSVGSQDLEDLLIYPNPNSGIFFINVPVGMDDLDLTIYSVLGAKVYNENGFSAGQQVTIDTSRVLSTGTYFVELSSNGNTTTKKLIIN